MIGDEALTACKRQKRSTVETEKKAPKKRGRKAKEEDFDFPPELDDPDDYEPTKPFMESFLRYYIR